VTLGRVLSACSPARQRTDRAVRVYVTRASDACSAKPRMMLRLGNTRERFIAVRIPLMAAGAWWAGGVSGLTRASLRGEPRRLAMPILQAFLSNVQKLHMADL
jgi:hypothetical protein